MKRFTQSILVICLLLLTYECAFAELYHDTATDGLEGSADLICPRFYDCMYRSPNGKLWELTSFDSNCGFEDEIPIGAICICTPKTIYRCLVSDGENMQEAYTYDPDGFCDFPEVNEPRREQKSNDRPSGFVCICARASDPCSPRL